MGRIKEIYVELRSRASLDGNVVPDFGVGECPVCNGNGCNECLHMGFVAKTDDDEPDPCMNHISNLNEIK